MGLYRPPRSRSSVSAQRRFAFGLVVMAAGALALSMVFKDKADDADGAADPAAAAQPGAADDRPAARGRRPGPRTALPRPTRTRAAGTPSTAPPTDPTPGVVAVDPDALPERGQVDATLPATEENIRAAIRQVGPGIEACVRAWNDELQPYAGKLTIEVELDATGIVAADLMDVEGVPAPVLGCFGASMYEVVWPAPEGESLVIRYPFYVVANLKSLQTEGDDGDPAAPDPSEGG